MINHPNYGVVSGFDIAAVGAPCSCRTISTASD
jgi:hypothetical protein